jgi:hypothetical protein
VTLEDLAYISQIIGVVAVIGSLIAIYFQQRQTNKIARAEISHGVSASYSGTLRYFFQLRQSPLLHRE